MVDDFVGMGGTLANLRGYIETHGGTVLAAIALTGKAHNGAQAQMPRTGFGLCDDFGVGIGGDDHHRMRFYDCEIPGEKKADIRVARGAFSDPEKRVFLSQLMKSWSQKAEHMIDLQKFFGLAAGEAAFGIHQVHRHQDIGSFPRQEQ